MILANGISSGFFIVSGLVVFFGINLVAITIECIVFKLAGKVSILASFKKILAANMASAIGGWFVFKFIDIPIRLHFGNIEQCFIYSTLILLLMILVYLIESIVIEFAVLRKLKFANKSGLSVKKFCFLLILANIISYIPIGWGYFNACKPIRTNLSLCEADDAKIISNDIVFIKDKTGQLYKMAASSSQKKPANENDLKSNHSRKRSKPETQLPNQIKLYYSYVFEDAAIKITDGNFGDVFLFYNILDWNNKVDFRQICAHQLEKENEIIFSINDGNIYLINIADKTIATLTTGEFVDVKNDYETVHCSEFD